MLDIEAESTDDFFKKMSGKLVDLNFVEKSFLEAIKKREANYPTALPTKPCAVAIPHADPIHIKKQFIAAVRLKNPVKWCEMATSDVWHDVTFVFVLGFKKEEGHIELLQILVEQIQDEILMEKLFNAQTVDEYQELVLSMLGFE